MTLFILVFLISSISLGSELKIKNAQELVELSTGISRGTNFYGTTVILDSDIDFFSVSKSFQPIGTNEYTYFNGTFDGQGISSATF